MEVQLILASGDIGCVARASTSAGVEIFSLCFVLGLNLFGCSVAPLASSRLQEPFARYFFSLPLSFFLSSHPLLKCLCLDLHLSISPLFSFPFITSVIMADKKGEVNQGEKSVLGMPVSCSSIVLCC